MRTNVPAVLSVMIAGGGVLCSPATALATTAAAYIIVAQNDEGSDQQPTPCDCTNCSAEHCQPPPRRPDTIDIPSFSWGATNSGTTNSSNEDHGDLKSKSSR